MDYKVSYREKDKSIQCIINYKNNDGEWKQKSKQGFKRQKDAKPWIEDTLRELDSTMNTVLNEEYKGVTFKKFIDIYIKDLENHKEPNTIISYKTIANKFSKLDRMALEDIQFIHVQNCANDMLKDGLSPSTVKEYSGKLKTILDRAVIPYKVIVANPIKSGINIPTTKTSKEVKALNKSEVDDLLKKIHPEKDYMISLIAVTCGLRIGEIMGLTWDDVDFVNGKLYVKKQWKELKDGTWGFGELKSKNSYRNVPIPPKTIVALKNYRANSAIDLINKRLFLDKRTKSTATRLFIKYEKLGFNVSVHDLRHTYATMLIASGIDFKTAAMLLGHTVEMTMKTYSHVNQDMIDMATNKINVIF